MEIESVSRFHWTNLMSQPDADRFYILLNKRKSTLHDNLVSYKYNCIRLCIVSFKSVRFIKEKHTIKYSVEVFKFGGAINWKCIKLIQTPEVII